MSAVLLQCDSVFSYVYSSSIGTIMQNNSHYGMLYNVIIMNIAIIIDITYVCRISSCITDYKANIY